MKCPIDQSELVRTERNGVEIDYCPTCRGVWLDRGELDKIIERATPDSASAAETTGGFSGQEWDTPTVGGMSGKVRPLASRETRADDDRAQTNEAREDTKTTRRSFLEELFDFG